MIAARSNEELARVAEYVRQHRDAFPDSSGDAALEVALHRKVYLSTLYRVMHGGERYLLAIKHHDPGGVRATREFQVLSLLGGSLSPRAVLLDTGRSVFDDPVLVSTFEQPALVKSWTDGNLSRLAQVLASIHTNRALLDLPIDRDRPASYSLSREFEDEVKDVPTFRDSALRTTILDVADTLRQQIPRFAEAVEDGTVTYVHSDLPHHHLFAVEPHWKTVHWEWSRRSHPTRELARALWDMELPADREQTLLDAYRALVPYPVTHEALEIQRLLQYFYNCVHVAFWLDRTGHATDSASWRKAEQLAGVVKLWIRMQLQPAA